MCHADVARCFRLRDCGIDEVQRGARRADTTDPKSWVDIDSPPLRQARRLAPVRRNGRFSTPARLQQELDMRIFTDLAVERRQWAVVDSCRGHNHLICRVSV